MIDYVSLKLNIDIPTDYFLPMIWKRGITDDGQPFCWRNIRGVKLKYYEETHNFTINGKILMCLHDTQVQNVDDIYGAKRSKNFGVYPYCFLDRKGSIAHLENPIKLLYQKLSALKVLS